MLLSFTTLFSLVLVLLSALPTSQASPFELHGRSITTILEIEAALVKLEASILTHLSNFTAIIDSYASFFSSIESSSPPTTISEILDTVSDIYAAPPSASTGNDVLGFAKMALKGLLPSNFSSLFDTNPFADSNNFYNNTNPINPNITIYPSKSSSDAPYSVPESTLRAAIKIPDTFKYGKLGKQPVVLVHGTGQTGGVNYLPNFAKLLATTSYADPVWLNIPTMLNQDAQISAEYVAYALNYISAISSSSNISVLAWSQGNVDTQWALKYWPSTRPITSDFLSMSPDFKGTYGILICPGFPLIPCDAGPSQQINTSKFLKTLRAGGGDAALVPTTVVYSKTDESVQPQPSGSAASSYLLDTNNIPVSNSRVQDVCAGKAAGGVFTHSGVLFNALSWALVQDALQHEGPGDISRIDLDTVCAKEAADGLDVSDVLQTQVLLAEAFVKIIEYPVKVTEEPAIMAYAA